MITTSLWLHLQTEMRTTPFLFTCILHIWKERRAYVPYEINRQERKRERLRKSPTRERVVAMVLQWTSLGATGMILAMVVPQLILVDMDTEKQVSVYFYR